MQEKVPWWRWAFEFALSGIRSGFGLFHRNGKVEAGPETNAERFVAAPESVEAEWIDVKPVEVETMGVESNAQETAELEGILRTESRPESEIGLRHENRQSEVESGTGEAAEIESEIALIEPDEPAELEAPEEEIALTNASPQPDESATGRAPEPPADTAVPAPGPSAELPFDPPLAAESHIAEPTTAEKVAAALKARGADAEQSPFSVFVGQIYDGPLDLLLDLIRKQDIDIYDIPIAKITAQFLAYVDHLRASDMDVAGDFIYTAALLIHIKSKMLLPRSPVGPEESAEDPRRELVDRLLEHERFKNAAQMLHDKQMLEANTWTNPGVREFREDAGAEPEIAADTTDLVRIFRDILERARNRPIINVEEDSVTVGQMIRFLTRRLTMEDKPVALRRLLSHTHSERALIAMFLGLLELVRLQAILLRQDRQFSEIFVKKNTGFEAVVNEGLAGAHDDWR
jgi:segregation and condensation protein A